MAWIKTISFANATGKLKQTYKRVVGPNGHIDNILASHSLRPHTLEGHMRLYKNVLHHNANQLDKSLLEAIGVYVSLLNSCDYCVEHHYQGYLRLIEDKHRAERVLKAMKEKSLETVFDQKEMSLFDYAEKLTSTPSSLTQSDIEKIKAQGFDDGEVLEVNQVIAYFNYANRTVLGLGVELENVNIGLSPNDSDDNENWGHS